MPAFNSQAPSASVTVNVPLAQPVATAPKAPPAPKPTYQPATPPPEPQTQRKPSWSVVIPHSGAGLFKAKQMQRRGVRRYAGDELAPIQQMLVAKGHDPKAVQSLQDMLFSHPDQGIHQPGWWKPWVPFLSRMRDPQGNLIDTDARIERHKKFIDELMKRNDARSIIALKSMVEWQNLMGRSEHNDAVPWKIAPRQTGESPNTVRQIEFPDGTALNVTHHYAKWDPIPGIHPSRVSDVPMRDDAYRVEWNIGSDPHDLSWQMDQPRQTYSAWLRPEEMRAVVKHLGDHKAKEDILRLMGSRSTTEPDYGSMIQDIHHEKLRALSPPKPAAPDEGPLWRPQDQELKPHTWDEMTPDEKREAAPRPKPKPPELGTKERPFSLKRHGVRRYSESDVSSLSKRLAEEKESHAPGSSLRMVLADAMEEAGHSVAADNLRSKLPMAGYVHHAGQNLYVVHPSGTAYHIGTHPNVMAALETARQNRTRVRVQYGHTHGPKAGEGWMDRFGNVGRVSRSMGDVKIPILVHNARSMGGSGILTGSIVQIKTAAGNRVLYQHPEYHQPEPDKPKQEQRRYAAKKDPAIDMGSLHEHQSDTPAAPKGFTAIKVRRTKGGQPVENTLHVRSEPGKLSIHDGKRLDEYEADESLGQHGRRITLLSKQEKERAEREGRPPEPYVVTVSPSGKASCTCPGFSGSFNSATAERIHPGYGYCRHADAIAALISKGIVRQGSLAKPKPQEARVGKNDLKSGIDPLLQGTRLGYHLLHLKAKYKDDSHLQMLLGKALKGDHAADTNAELEEELRQQGRTPLGNVHAAIGERLAHYGDPLSRAYRWGHMSRGLNLDRFTGDAVKKLVKVREGSKVDDTNFYDNVLRHLLPTHQSEFTGTRGNKKQSGVTAHYADSRLIVQALANANPQQQEFWKRLTSKVRSQMGDVGLRVSDADIVRSLVRHYFREQDREELKANKKRGESAAAPNWKQYFGAEPWRTGDHRRPGNPERFKRRYAREYHDQYGIDRMEGLHYPYGVDRRDAIKHIMHSFATRKNPQIGYGMGPQFFRTMQSFIRHGDHALLDEHTESAGGTSLSGRGMFPEPPPPSPRVQVTGTTTFQPGGSGTKLDPYKIPEDPTATPKPSTAMHDDAGVSFAPRAPFEQLRVPPPPPPSTGIKSPTGPRKASAADPDQPSAKKPSWTWGGVGKVVAKTAMHALPLAAHLLQRGRRPLRYSHSEFLSRIAADPKYDSSKLVYADWLEEHGFPEMTRLLRDEVAGRNRKGIRLAMVGDRSPHGIILARPASRTGGAVFSHRFVQRPEVRDRSHNPEQGSLLTMHAHLDPANIRDMPAPIAEHFEHDPKRIKRFAQEMLRIEPGERSEYGEEYDKQKRDAVAAHVKLFGEDINEPEPHEYRRRYASDPFWDMPADDPHHGGADRLQQEALARAKPGQLPAAPITAAPTPPVPPPGGARFGTLKPGAVPPPPPVGKAAIVQPAMRVGEVIDQLKRHGQGHIDNYDPQFMHAELHNFLSSNPGWYAAHVYNNEGKAARSYFGRSPDQVKAMVARHGMTRMSRRSQGSGVSKTVRR